MVRQHRRQPPPREFLQTPQSHVARFSLGRSLLEEQSDNHDDNAQINGAIRQIEGGPVRQGNEVHYPSSMVANQSIAKIAHSPTNHETEANLDNPLLRSAPHHDQDDQKRNVDNAQEDRRA